MKRLHLAFVLTLGLAAPAAAQLDTAWSDLRPVASVPGGYGVAKQLLPRADGTLFCVINALDTPDDLVVLRHYAPDGSFVSDTVCPEAGLDPFAAFDDGPGGVRVLCRAQSTPQRPKGLVLLAFDCNGGSTLLERWDVTRLDPVRDHAVAARADDGTMWVAIALEAPGTLHVRRIDANGATLAGATLSGFPAAAVRSIALDPQGGAVIAGNYGGEPSVWSFDASATLRWTRVVSAWPVYSDSSFFSQVLIDPSTGTVFAGGSVYWNLWIGRGILRAWAADGTQLWAEDFSSPFGGLAWVNTIAISSDRRLWASVKVGNQSFDSKAVVVCRGLDGARHFEQMLSPPGAYGLHSTRFAALTAGRMLMLWTLPNPGQNWYTDSWLCELDSEGNVREQRVFGLPQRLEDLGGFVLGKDRAYLCGYASIPQQLSTRPWVIAVDTSALPAETCRGTPSSLGCETVLTCSGRASVSQPFGLVFHATGLANRSDAVLLYGTHGGIEVPFQSGWRCVAAPLTRVPALSTGGSELPTHDCSGSFALCFDRLAMRDPALDVVGTEVTAQLWCRDSANPTGAGYLTKALQFRVQP